MLTTVAAAPVALAVRAFYGTASSPKSMGRVIVHLAMLSTVSAWNLPPYGESITGKNDGARDWRQLDQAGPTDRSSCDGSWSVSTPAPCLALPSLECLAVAFARSDDETCTQVYGSCDGGCSDTCNGFWGGDCVTKCDEDCEDSCIATSCDSDCDVCNAEFIPHCPPGSCDGNWSVSAPAPRLAFPLMILASAFARSNDECDHTCATIMNHDDPDRSSYGYGEYTMTNHLTDGPPVKFYT